MVYGAMAGSAGASAAAAVIQAIKASGVIVRVEPKDFTVILAKSDEPLVVTAKGGLWKTNYQYLTSYKGLAFFTKSAEPLRLGRYTEVIDAKKIWIPSC